MIVLDAGALAAAALEEPGADEVAALLRAGTCALPTAALAELLDTLVRGAGVDPALAAERIDALLDGAVVLRELDRARAERAGLLFADDDAAELSLAERIVLASLEGDDSLATADARLVRLARALGFEVVALPRGAPAP